MKILQVKYDMNTDGGKSINKYFLIEKGIPKELAELCIHNKFKNDDFNQLLLIEVYNESIITKYPEYFI